MVAAFRGDLRAIVSTLIFAVGTGGGGGFSTG